MALHWVGIFFWPVSFTHLALKCYNTYGQISVNKIFNV